ncbi:MAG: CHAT domain-containing tetratricopeptide repeat protein [Anaerolineae bacterium]
MASNHLQHTSVLFLALAVLGWADEAALAAVLGDGSAADAYAALAARPDVTAQADGLTPHAAVAAEALLALEAADAPRYRALHERAVAHLANRRRAGDERVQAAFDAAYLRLANRLLTDDPVAFCALVDQYRAVAGLPGRDADMRGFFEALALGLSGRPDAAVAAFNALLATPGLDDEVSGRALNARAYYNSVTGRLEDAQRDYRACLALWRATGNRLREGITLLNLGILAYDLHQYGDAEGSLAEAIAAFGEVGSAQHIASAQNELGLVYRDQGRWADALACFEAVAERRRADGALDSLGRALNNIGEVRLFQGRLDEAESAFNAALAAMQTADFAVDARLNLGLARQVAGDLAGAGAAFEAALATALAIGRRDILAEVYYRLGEAARRGGDDVVALDRFVEAATVIEATREPLQDEGLKISLLGRWQQIYEALVLQCLALGRVEDAFLWSERARARAFADAVAAQQVAAPADAAWQAGAVASLAEVQAALADDVTLLSYFTTGVMAREIPLLQSLPTASPLRAHLVTPARTLLFTVARHAIAAAVCPVDPNALAATTARGNDPQRFLAPQVLRRLFTFLLAPAESALQSRRLFISPHGPLHTLPFAAIPLPTGEPLAHAGGPRLAFIPSATVFVRHCRAARPLPEPRLACLAIGYNGRPESSALRHTEAEAAFVAHLTGGVAHVGASAKAPLLAEAAPGARWLHFACHGQFRPDAPLESFLETGDGERLTALQVLQAWRLRADLVTLSACETGVSQILRGDEPMGLVRAFLYAGARAALVSLWPVEDLPTFLLMQRFYQGLSADETSDPSAALRDAQAWLRSLTAGEALGVAPLAGDSLPHVMSALAARDTAEQPFAAARYWAGFLIVGGACG